MGLLDQLWDDTVAIPRPEYGLDKLRKYSTFNSRPNSAMESKDGGDGLIQVTRKIMIVRPLGYQGISPEVSPSGSTPPVSPFSGNKEWVGFSRKPKPDASKRAVMPLDV